MNTRDNAVQSPAPVSALVQNCRDKIKQGKLDEAIALARKAVASEQKKPAAYILLAQLLGGAGAHRAALDASQTAIGLGSGKADHLFFHAQLLARCGQRTEALHWLEKLPAGHENNDEANFLRIRLLIESGHGDKASGLLRQSWETVTDKATYFKLLGELAAARNKPNNAIRAFNQAIKLGKPDSGLALHLARVLVADGQSDRAQSVLAQAKIDFPDHLPVRKMLTHLLFDAAKIEDATGEARAIVEIAGARLPETLREAIDQARRMADLYPSENQRIEQIWSHLGRPAGEHDDWIKGINLGRYINAAVKNWVMSRQADISQLDAMVDEPDWTDLDDVLKAGRGAVICLPHLGVQHVALEYLRRQDWPLLSLGNNIVDGLVHGGGRFLSVEHISAATIIKLRDHLQGPGVLTLASDGKYGDDPIIGNIFDQKIHLGRGAPDLAFWTGAQILWCAAGWKGEKIQIELDLGPTPNKGEDIGAWRVRWAAYYCNCQENMIAASPLNIRANYGQRLINRS